MTTPNPPDFGARNIQRVLNDYHPVPVSNSGLIAAAVLIPFLGSGPNHRLLFTVRTSKVEHHKGEVSFPGGARDDEDATLEATALREAWEEVGIEPSDVRVLGRISDHETRSGFAVTPFVGSVVTPSYNPSGLEVAELLEVPAREIWDRYRQGPEMVSYGGGPPAPVYEFHHQGHRIWGATARMLVDFLKVMDAASGPHPSTQD